MSVRPFHGGWLQTVVILVAMIGPGLGIASAQEATDEIRQDAVGGRVGSSALPWILAFLGMVSISFHFLLIQVDVARAQNIARRVLRGEISRAEGDGEVEQLARRFVGGVLIEYRLLVWLGVALLLIGILWLLIRLFA